MLCLALLAILAACAPQVEQARLVITPFPSTTPGRVIHAEIANPAQDNLAANPATAVAIVRQPTATPDLTLCPSPAGEDDARLEDTAPQNPDIVIEEIVRFLSAGGAPGRLNDILRGTWGLIAETGTFRADVDLTGEGSAEMIISYTTPENRGALLVLGCRESAYRVLYQSEADIAEAPVLVDTRDMNYNGLNDLVFAARACPTDEDGTVVSSDPDDCDYVTRLLSWLPDEDRFANLMEDDVLTGSPPEINDFDNDQVSELVFRLDNSGNSITGPLRTGTNIYDWDGVSYVLSIAQPDAPRYRIQVLQDGDRAAARNDMQTAIAIYREALDESNDLRYWFDDEPELLRSYALYRLALAQVAANSVEQTETYQQILTTYADPAAAPVYAQMARVFFETVQATGDVSGACAQVQAIIAQRGEALELLNRYGSRSPRYTAQQLCPF